MKYLLEEGLSFLVLELYFVVIVLILCVFGVVYNNKIITLNKRLLEVVAKLGLLSVVWLLWLAYESNIESYLFNYQIKKDNLNLFLILLVLFGLGCCILMSLDYIKNDSIDSFEYILLLLLFCSMSVQGRGWEVGGINALLEHTTN